MDLRVQIIFDEEMKGDTSFREKGSFMGELFGRNHFSNNDMRETWDRGIKHGIEIGLRRASIEGQQLEMYHNIDNPHHKAFIDKFYKLAEEYGCAIQHHPQNGLMIINNKRN